MPTKLRNLKITRVDLVDKGANQHAHVLFYKAAKPPFPPKPDDDEEDDKGKGKKKKPAIVEAAEKRAYCEAVLKLATEKCGYDGGLMITVAQTYEDMLLRQQKHKLFSALNDRFYALLDTIDTIVKSDADKKPKLIRSAVDDFLSSMEAQLPSVLDDTLAKSVHALRELRIFKQEQSPMPQTDIEKAERAAEIKKAVDDAVAAVTKAADDKLAAELAKRDTEIEKAKTEAAAEKTLRRQKEFADLAKSYAPVVAAGEAELLRKVADVLDAETWGKLQDILKRATAQVQESMLLKDARDEIVGHDGDDTAAGALLKAAKELVAKGEAKTIEQATDHVLATNADLAKRYANESSTKRQRRVN